MQKFQKILIKPKKKKTWLTVKFNKQEVGQEGQQFDAKWTKESNQLLSKELSTCIDKLIPHLLIGAEMVLIPETDSLESWYKFIKDMLYNADDRFAPVVITSVEFVGSEVLQAVKIFGYRETQLTDKPFKVKLETPVINLDRVDENRYKFVVALDEQIQELNIELDNWLERGATLSKAQQTEMQLT